MTPITITFPKRTQEKETSLLMHYLDVVFPLQFPVHDRSYEGKREWLLAILTSSRSVYYATLSLSLLHKESRLDDFESVWQSERTRYYILALQESQQLLDQIDTADGVAKLKGNIHALASTVQLISIESSSLSLGDWQVHLLAGKALIPELVHGWTLVPKSGRFTSSVWTVLDAPQFSAAHDEDTLSFEYVGALQFLTNILAMFGIFSCISIGPASASFAEYRYLLDQEGMIQMDQIIGCKNWVLLAILEVGELDKWKRVEQEHHRLSLKDLGNRATVIEEMIETGLRESSGSALVDLVTSIYATSTLTYMHTVVSGLNPNLREVQDSVAATMVLLKQLPDVRIAKNLVWSLVVTGCMASLGQEDFFRGLNAVAGTSVRGLRNCWGLATIWDRTWNMRDTITTTSHTVWEDLINGQGPPNLLV
ncbi:Tri10 [Stachybotrys chartarum IBT 7711]|uniref:Tri10 n=1 Tax=Stachybotrys chartarum (strain CBS 109288 / IBT 7711) TaxID=1280523 RepID=A0A084AFF9_STACB|nr:Tri10 [Stachybotrys chartarum IBT 7711]KFA45303.1 Tri10 [Stachybotrys chartarum IBT 40293]KFA71056.1 Tri10 [Stachybotrys chartarum IBT 40288]